MAKLSGKRVLVTGGTSGIGLAAARLFAAEGAHVTVTGSRPESVAQAREALEGIAEVVLSDAGSGAEIRALAERFGAPGGAGLDILFLNAGVAKFGALAQIDEDVFDESFRINVKGPWLAIKHLGPLLKRGGAIVVNGSINAQLGMPGSGVYAATKAAVRSLVRVAAVELAESGVRVNAITPGPTDTPLYGKLGMSAEQVQGFAKDLAARIPLRRFGTPEEVAKVALFLASDDAAYITGEDIVVDGGMTQV